MMGFIVDKNGTNQTALVTNQYDLVTWSTLRYGRGWSLSNNRITTLTPGLKQFFGEIWFSAGIGDNQQVTVKLTQGGDDAKTGTVWDNMGADVQAAIVRASAVSGIVTVPFNFMWHATVENQFYRLFAKAVETSAGAITIDGNKAHTYINGISHFGRKSTSWY